MENIYQNWIDFCDERKEFDKSHFIGLFKMGLNDEKLKEILNYFPNKEVIYLRLKEVLNAGSMVQHIYLMPKKENRLNQPDLLDKAKVWNDERANYCQKVGEVTLYQIVANAKTEFSSKETVNKAKEDVNLPEAELYDLLCDNVIFSTKISSKQVDALFEAAYGLAANYFLSWYICQPLLDIDIDFYKYFEFWKGGGISALTQDKLLVAYIF